MEVLSFGGLSNWLAQNLTANAISSLIAPDYANATVLTSTLTPSNPYTVQQVGWIFIRTGTRPWNVAYYYYINGFPICYSHTNSGGDGYTNTQVLALVTIGDIVTCTNRGNSENPYVAFIPFKNL